MGKRTGFKCVYCGRNFSKDCFKSDGDVGECFSCAAIYRNDGGNIVEVSHIVETKGFPYYRVVFPNGVAIQGDPARINLEFGNNMKRWVEIYKQTYGNRIFIKKLNKDDLAFGFTKIPCLDCNGTGLFLMPDDSQEVCVACKGIGWNWATL